MPIFDRFNIGLVGAVVGLCGIGIGVSPDAAALPLKTGGDEACVGMSAGEVGSPPAGACMPAAATVADMAGVPFTLPGPIPAVAPVVPALPVLPPLPLAPVTPVVPAAAPVPGGAPLVEMAGVGGKGDPIAPPRQDALANGQPILPGPAG